MSFLDDAYRDGVVVGLKGTGKVVPRLDIDVLMMEHPDTFNLMCMALLELQCADVPWVVDPAFKVHHEDKFSYTQMAGIHGYPLNPWDPQPDSPGENASHKPRDGYCAHGKPTFEVWHRPYLAMLEQTLYRQMKNIAGRFKDPEKTKYIAAVEDFRLPYYDYFRPRGHGRLIPGLVEPDIKRDLTKNPPVPERKRGTAMMAFVRYDFSLPQIFTLPKIMIRTYPDNDLKLVQNPFFQFKIPEHTLSDVEWQNSGLDRSVPHGVMKTLRYGADKPRSVTWMNDNLNKLREDTLRLTLTLMEGAPARTEGTETSNDHSPPVPQDMYMTLEAVATNAVLAGKDAYEKLLETLQPGSSFRIKPEPRPDTKATDEEKLHPPGWNTGIAFHPDGSLEAVHNDYHVYLGGFTGTRNTTNLERKVGHMTCVPVSAFDPVFWIHHCQIDRLFAVWQAVHPKRWFEDLPDYPGKPDWLKLDLEPFRKTKVPLTYYRPNDCRYVEDFGYTYPDVKDKEKSVDAIRDEFVNKYAWSRRLLPFPKLTSDTEPPDDMKPLDLKEAQVYQYPPGSSDEYLFDDLADLPDKKVAAEDEIKIQSEFEDYGRSHEWYIDDMFVRTQFEGSATIFYIIETGGVPGNSAPEWTRLPGFAGLTHIFAAPTKACSNCAAQSEDQTIVTSTTAITSLLLDYVEIGELKSLQKHDVLPFLTKHLKWRIQKTNGEAVKSREAKFRISVSEKIAPLPGRGGFIEYNRYMDIMADIIAVRNPKPVTTH